MNTEDLKNPISEHFTLSEVEHSDTAKRLNIDNTLPAPFYTNAQNLAKYILEPIRAHFGAFSPQSWYRSQALNKAVGSKDTSQHRTASAADFEIKGYSNLEIALWIRDNLVYDQLILEGFKDGDPSSGWVHCSWDAGLCRQQSLRFINGTYLKGLE